MAALVHRAYFSVVVGGGRERRTCSVIMYKFYSLYLVTVYGLAAGAAQSGSKGCVLPPYPPHGTYTVYDKPDAIPGQTYDLAILTVTCDPGYGVVGNNATYCFSNNNWQQPMPRCTRFCRLTPDPSVNYFCKVTGDDILSGTRKCRELEPNGTVVVPECNRPVYYSNAVLRNMRCFEGTWDHVAVCQPDCGTSTAKGQGLIINGTRTAHGEFPWHAAIYDKTYTPIKQVCGGSLVSTKLIISAAHCFWIDPEGQQPASRYAVALGKIYRGWDEVMDPGAHKSEVSEIRMPKRFLGEAGHYQDDIAILIMKTPVVYVTYIRPVCVDLSEEFDRNQLQSSHSGKVSGWGLTSTDGNETSVLMTVELPYVDVGLCIDDLTYEFRPYVTSDKICAGSKDGKTVCKGDSGGGLVFPNEDRNTLRYFLRGVVSTAPTSGFKCNANSYTTFTHILRHATFIKDNGVGIVSVRDGPVRIGGCVLPEYPAHGTYTVHNRPDAVPGQAYDKVFLTVTCDPGYRVLETSSAFCVGDNKWSEPRPQCSRFCKLTPHPSVKYLCRVPGEDANNTRLCDEYEPSGTVVLPKCNRPNYYHPGDIKDMHCDAGNWDQVTICQPECGITKVEPNPNATHAALGEVPWHAGIYDKNLSPFGQICGGSLVSNKIVLSAAHCFWKGAEKLQSPSRYLVALGKIYRPWNDPMDSGAHKSDVSDIKVPVSFRGLQTLFKDDIALLFLTTPVVYAAHLRPVCIDYSVEFDRSQLQGSNTGKAAGWGLTSEDGAPSHELKTMELEFVNEEVCIDHLPYEFISSFTSDKICASPVKGVVCKGDAGGGVAFPTVDSQGTQRYYLRGVMSTAPRNNHKCNVYSDVLLTHVLKHESFIRKHLDNNFV